MSAVLSASVPASSLNPSRATRANRRRVAPAVAPSLGAGTAGASCTVPLSALELSPRNVRKAAAEGIDELAALIRSQGLLQPLCVTRIEGEPPRFAVEAGGRRLRALQSLASQGELAPDAGVDCRLVELSQAHEVSLAENSARQAMHPADQCEAFLALLEAGRSVEQIAQRFGVALRTVQRRLRLANVAPELVALFRAGDVSLDQMQALAITDDRERQLAVWNGSDSWARAPWQLRRRLLGDEVPLDDPRVRLVGLHAYEEAGGVLRRDLFSERGETFITDPVLLDRLVSARLHAEADAVLAEGWAWTEPRLSFDHSERSRFRVLARPRRVPTDEEARELAALRDKLDRANAALDAAADQDDPDEVAVAALQTEADRIEAQIRAIDGASCDWSAEHRAGAGAIVALERGQVAIYRGLVRPENLDQAQPGDSGGSTGACTGTGTASSRPEHSERLMLALTSHRTAAMQASLVAAPEVALAALAHRLVLALRAPYHPCAVGIDAKASRSTLERHAPDLAESRAGQALDQERTRWGNLLPGEPAALLGWLLAQPQTTLVELLAFCTAETLDASHGAARVRDDGSALLAESLSLDMADWWEPTAETYLDSVPKARIVAAVTQACGASASADLAAMKKADAVKAAALRLAGTRWLPAPLRAGGAVEGDAS
jgi:ParB family transcriptional regulator, chromosome partitioning protein